MIIELFWLSLTVEWAFFEKSADFRWKGHRPPTTVGVRKTRVIALLRGIKIPAVHCLVLSWHTWHRWPDKITSPKTT